MKDTIIDLFQRRFACHNFQPERQIENDALMTILEAGRLSPSSFGLEHWKFVVVTKPEEKAALQDACFRQHQVGSASAVIVILAKIADMHPDSDYIKAIMAREYPGEALEPAMANYRTVYAHTEVKSWSIMQCYIAAANMMTATTAVGLDSCAIGGFLPDKVKKIIDKEGDRYEIALVLPIGYCADAPHEKMRLPMSELVEYR